MLYTRKGDKGNTSVFGCKQKFSKNSVLIEALGTLDELNSLLGLCKVKLQTTNYKLKTKNLFNIIEQVQQNLFIIQANLAGADKNITPKKISEMEKIIDGIEKQLPSIRNFFLAGGTEQAAYLDYARTVARRVERRIIALSETQKINAKIIIYLNRLSSLLYALARFANLKSGIVEKSPSY